MTTLYSKDGTVKIEHIHKFTHSSKFMGESFLLIPFASDDIIDFEIGDYVMFRDEKFVLNYSPAKKKQASKGSYGKAFEYDNVKFNSLSDELTMVEFIDIVKHDNGIHYTSQPTFTFHANSVHDLVDRIQANLDLEFKDDRKWTVEVSPDVISKSKNISISNITIWGAVALVNTEFGLNFSVKNRTIIIGESGVDVGKVFAYGKGKGLFDIQQTTNQDAKIITRLRAYGSTRNIPRRYYNDLKKGNGEPYILASEYIPNLMLPSFPYTESDASKVFIDSPNIEKYGVRYGSVYFNEEENEIYPSIENMTSEELSLAGVATSLKPNDNGNLDEVLGADNPVDDGVIPEEGKGLKGQFKIYLKDLGFDLTEKDKNGQYKYATTDIMQISMKSGMCVGRAFDVVDWGITKDTSLGYTRYILECNRLEDKSVGMAYPNKDWEISEGDKFVILGIALPDVYIKSASQKLLVASKEFLSQNDETKYTYQPTISSNFMANNPELGNKISVGDILTFKDNDLGIDASEIIQTLNIEYDLNKSSIPTYKVTLSNDRIAGKLEKMQSSINTLMSNTTGVTINQVKSLIHSIGTAMFLRKDITDSTDFLQKFLGGAEFGQYGKKKGAYINEEGIADFEKVVSKDTDFKEMHAEKAIAKVATLNDLTAELAKIHGLEVSDTATILKAVVKEYFTSEKFVSGFAGEGFRIAQTINGDWNLEIDNLIVRKLFNVFELLVQEIKHQGGMMLHSPAGGKITKVTDGGSYWKCEIESADTFFKDDLIICQKFTGTIKRYWRAVTSVGTGYLNLSKTDCEANSAIPQIDDEIAVQGNKTNTSRQSVYIINVVGEDAPYTAYYSGINSYSLKDKLVTREGNLNGIVDKDFGQLKGYGLYATNAYLKGILRLTNGKTVEQELLSTNNTVEANRLQLGGEIDKAKADSKNANDKIDGLQIGGVNLLNGTSNEFVFRNNQGGWYVQRSFNYPLEFGKTYTLSLYFKCEDSEPLGYGTVGYGKNKVGYSGDYLDFYYKSFVLINSDERIYRAVFTFKFDKHSNMSVNDTYYFAYRVRRFIKLTPGTRTLLKAEMLEESTKPSTTWTPSLADQQSELDKQITSVRTDFDVIEGQINANVKETQRLISVSNEQVNQATEASNKAQQNADKAKLDADLANKKALEAQINADKTKADANASNQSKLDAQAKADEAKAQADKANQEAIKAKSDADKALDSANKAKEAQDKSEGVLQSVATKEAGINVVAGQVDIKAKEATESATRAETAEANINTKADGIVMEASRQSAEKAIEGLEIGGRNYFAFYKMSSYAPYNSLPILIDGTKIRTVFNNGKFFTIGSEAWTKYNMIEDGIFIFSGYITINGEIPLNNPFKNNFNTYYSYHKDSVYDSKSGFFCMWSKVAKSNSRQWAMHASVDSLKTGDIIIIDKPQLERATKVSDWSPAPEDTDAKFQATKARFELLDNQISAEVSKTDGIRTDLTTLSQDHDSFKVQVKTDIDGAIDSNNEVIKSSFEMNGNKIGLLGSEIDITGKVTFSALDTNSQAKITRAESDAYYALDGLDELKTDLGDLAYFDVIEKAKLGTTVIEGGFIKTELIKTDELVSKKVKTANSGPRFEMEGSEMRVYGDGVHPNMIFGVNEAGYAVMEYYTPSGDKLYDLGPSGISMLDFAPVKWTEKKLKRFSTEKSKENLTSQDFSKIVNGDVTQTNSPIYYNYYAGGNPTVSQEEREREKYTYASINGPKIADGWYYFPPYANDRDYRIYLSNNSGNFIKPEAGGLYNDSYGVLDRDNIYIVKCHLYVGGILTDSANYYFQENPKNDGGGMLTPDR